MHIERAIMCTSVYPCVHLTSKNGVHTLCPGNIGSDQGYYFVVAHVEGGVLAVIIGATDVVTPSPDPNRTITVATSKRPTGDKPDIVDRSFACKDVGGAFLRCWVPIGAYCDGWRATWAPNASTFASKVSSSLVGLTDQSIPAATVSCNNTLFNSDRTMLPHLASRTAM